MPSTVTGVDAATVNWLAFEALGFFHAIVTYQTLTFTCAQFRAFDPIEVA
jgi:hypothetical protein